MPKSSLRRSTLRCTLLLATGLLLGADAKEEDVRKELKKIEGTWALEAGEKDGTTISAEDRKKSKIVWKGKEYTLEAPHLSKETIQGTLVSIDPAKTPHEMEWRRSTGPDKDQSILVLYEWLDKDRFRVCFGPGGKERPKEFTTKPGSGHVLEVWKRVKE